MQGPLADNLGEAEAPGFIPGDSFLCADPFPPVEKEKDPENTI